MEALIKSRLSAATQKPGKTSTERPSMMTLSDDNVMLKQIKITHSPDAREVEVKVLLGLVEDILNRATLHTDTTFTGSEKLMEKVEDKLQQAHIMNILDNVSYAIDRISCEISCKALSGSETHETTMAILDLLSHYHWDSKLVLTLAAFSLNYGEFWLLVQIYSSNQLAKSLAMLRLVPTFLEHTGTLKPKFDVLNNLIREMMKVARSVVELRELPEAYISSDVPELSTAINNIPIAVYWTIRSVLDCVAQITMITTMGHELVHSLTETWELSTLADKLKNINGYFSERLQLCYQHIEGKMDAEALKMLYNLFNTTHIDNMRVLKALIYAKDDIPPLLDGSTKERVHLDVLRKKSVLLLISDLNISADELSILEHIYTESRDNLVRHDRDRHMPYEVVWIPIMDPTVDYEGSPYLQRKFKSLQSTMPWYSVHHPRIIQKHVVEFIKERWHFMNKAILVVLDPQGREASLNAIHMMLIWGSVAFPFTRIREETLWSEETWKLDLLVNVIDQVILNWITKGSYIFLYGGDDIEWIRNFTSAARALARDADIELEMVYVGKRNHSHRESIRRITSIITAEKLSHCWTDPASMWFFWMRLESMLYSKIQLGKADEHDEVMQGIKKILSYDKSGGWATLAKGSEIIMTSHKAISTIISVYEKTWKRDVESKGFRKALVDYHSMNVRDISHPCSQLDFHVTARSGRIPEMMICVECHRGMEKYISFLCCHDDEDEPETLEKFNF